jgi:hypothetical protein
MSLKTKTENLLENREIPVNDPERLLRISLKPSANFNILSRIWKRHKKEGKNFVQARKVPFAVAYYQCKNADTGHVNQVLSMLRSNIYH